MLLSQMEFFLHETEIAHYGGREKEKGKMDGTCTWRTLRVYINVFLSAICSVTRKIFIPEVSPLELEVSN